MTPRYWYPLNVQVLPEDVRKLVDQGDVIGAIKLHRERTGAGLAEAKRAIDHYRGKQQ